MFETGKCVVHSKLMFVLFYFNENKIQVQTVVFEIFYGRRARKNESI